MRSFERFGFCLVKQGKAVCVCVCTALSHCLSLRAHAVWLCTSLESNLFMSPEKAKLLEPRFSVCLSQNPVVTSQFKTRQSILYFSPFAPLC